MDENIDLTKILEGCEGIELYSVLHGTVIFERIQTYINAKPTIIINKEGQLIEYYKDGKYYLCYKDAECLLFPSKEQRDWSKFQRPLKEGTPVMYSDFKDKLWSFGYYKSYDSNKYNVYIGISKTSKWVKSKYVIPFDKFNPNDIEDSLKYNIQK